MSNFTLQKTDGQARAGVLHTRRGDIETPFFFSVATRGAIKGSVSVDDLTALQAPAVLANTYHLQLRPGSELIASLGGLHQAMKWNGPILTDSGGFQVFSIKSKKITDDGVQFRSHIDGEQMYLDAEKSIEIQHHLGSDILMAFDDCPPSKLQSHQSSTRALWYRVAGAVDRTTVWAERSLSVHFAQYDQSLSPTERPQIFGIVQGGCFPELRQKSLEAITALPFDGFALGGLAVGETHQQMYGVLDEMVHQLPADKPHYLMGVGTPANLLEAIGRGIDMFDCVMPMRNARHGSLFTSEGKMMITNACFRDDTRVIDPECTCPVCAEKQYSRAYIHHLMRVGEDLGKRLCTIHNLGFYHQLMRTARKKILEGTFEEWKQSQLRRWEVVG